MSIHRTVLGGGLVLLLILLVLACTGCEQEPDSVALTAADCAANPRCYP